MKKIILIFALYWLVLPLVFAGSVDFGDTNKTGNETFSRATFANELNWTQDGTNPCYLTAGMLACDDADKTGYINQLPDITKNTANYSCEFKASMSSCDANGWYGWGWGSTNNTANSIQIHIEDTSSTIMEWRNSQTGTNTNLVGVIADGTMHHYKFTFGTDRLASIYVDGIYNIQHGWNVGFEPQFFTIVDLGICDVRIDNFTCYNGSVYPPSPADLSPPSITYFNLTSSDNGCENWNTNKSNACTTSSVTPAVQFNTSEPAWCAIAGSSSSTALDKNYTDMESLRNCTGAASGENTKEHFCTVTNYDEIVYDVSYLFISCKDSAGNQNRTSTSGPLKINISNLEATARNSIELGISNSLSSGYTVYTDQKVYARNSADSQKVGTFDKVVKKLSKIWAFNWIGPSESHINMMNITPVLYTLEFANVSSTNMTLRVELLVNATK